MVLPSHFVSPVAVTVKTEHEIVTFTAEKETLPQSSVIVQVRTQFVGELTIGGVKVVEALVAGEKVPPQELDHE